ncbi:hypothetical protein GPSY_1408 [Paraglaciecola psychrophila 170]|nr:hypothetical protein GPSY_1408 [Paraglaciecola psychrophila 170]
MLSFIAEVYRNRSENSGKPLKKSLVLPVENFNDFTHY